MRWPNGTSLLHSGSSNRLGAWSCDRHQVHPIRHQVLCKIKKIMKNLKHLNPSSRVTILVATNEAILRELLGDVQLSDDEREALKKLYIDNFKELCMVGL
jgi:hypothetical protein